MSYAIRIQVAQVRGVKTGYDVVVDTANEAVSALAAVLVQNDQSTAAGADLGADMRPVTEGHLNFDKFFAEDDE